MICQHSEVIFFLIIHKMNLNASFRFKSVNPEFIIFRFKRNDQHNREPGSGGSVLSGWYNVM